MTDYLREYKGYCLTCKNYDFYKTNNDLYILLDNQSYFPLKTTLLYLNRYNLSN